MREAVSVRSLVCDLYNGVDLFVTFIMMVTCAVCHSTGEKLFQCEVWDYCLIFFFLKICKIKTFVNDLYGLFHFPIPQERSCFSVKFGIIVLKIVY